MTALDEAIALARRHRACLLLEPAPDGIRAELRCESGYVRTFPFDAAEGALVSLVALVKRYTRPDGGVDWARHRAKVVPRRCPRCRAIVGVDGICEMCEGI